MVVLHIYVVGQSKSVELRDDKSKYKIRASREQKGMRIKGRTI